MTDLDALDYWSTWALSHLLRESEGLICTPRASAEVCNYTQAREHPFASDPSGALTIEERCLACLLARKWRREGVRRPDRVI